MKNDIVIKQVALSAVEYKQVWELREEVLRKPIGLSLMDEDLTGDAEDIILIAMRGDKVIACVMLKPRDNGALQLRQMAVKPGLQKKGVGTQLVRAAENAAIENSFNKMILHAREVAVGFYQKLGYTITSDTFIEVGIPHVVMEKQLG